MIRRGGRRTGFISIHREKQGSEVTENKGQSLTAGNHKDAKMITTNTEGQPKESHMTSCEDGYSAWYQYRQSRRVLISIY
jgi:hypothetical protein